MKFEDYERLTFERKAHGVLLITINRPEKLNAVDATMSRELVTVWRDINADEATRVAVITGAGRAFSAGGEVDTRFDDGDKHAAAMDIHRDGRDLVTSILDCEKPIISAINGVAVGAGLAVALLADISIIGRTVKFTDGHVRIGLSAGDHAAIIWPLLCGVARAKYLLLTGDFVDGAEAERIGLVSKAVADEDVLTEALSIADRLGRGPQIAQQFTKASINHWIRAARPAFEASLALEMLTLLGDDAAEGMAAVIDKRKPDFPSGR